MTSIGKDGTNADTIDALDLAQLQCRILMLLAKCGGTVSLLMSNPPPITNSSEKMRWIPLLFFNWNFKSVGRHCRYDGTYFVASRGIVSLQFRSTLKKTMQVKAIMSLFATYVARRYRGLTYLDHMVCLTTDSWQICRPPFQAIVFPATSLASKKKGDFLLSIQQCWMSRQDVWRARKRPFVRFQLNASQHSLS